jgi:myosin-5
MIKSMDLKRLCSAILEKTIADTTMYQNGLTKIFFRAGMLAALESLRSNRLNAMVTVIQKNMRRRMAVNKYRKLRSAAIKIQTWWRGIMARRLVESIRREVSAIRLQTGIRRFIQRKHFSDTRRAIVLFQSRESPKGGWCYTALIRFFRHSWCASQEVFRPRKARAGCRSFAEPCSRGVCGIYFSFC